MYIWEPYWSEFHNITSAVPQRSHLELLLLNIFINTIWKCRIYSNFLMLCNTNYYRNSLYTVVLDHTIQSPASCISIFSLISWYILLACSKSYILVTLNETGNGFSYLFILIVFDLFFVYKLYILIVSHLNFL